MRDLLILLSLARIDLLDDESDDADRQTKGHERYFMIFHLHTCLQTNKNASEKKTFLI